MPPEFAFFFVLVVALGVGSTIWKVSTARRMARESGMNEGDATAMALLTDDGFEATYLASNLRPQPSPPQSDPASTPAPSSEVRLRELKNLLDQELISQAEHDARRQAIIDSL
jgi:hypothetical protein